MPRGLRKPVGIYFGAILEAFSDVFSGPCFQRMPREKAKRHKRNSPRKPHKIRTFRPSRHSKTCFFDAPEPPQEPRREKQKESEREAPTSNGRARARSARARAHPRLSGLAGLQLGMLLLLLRGCCSRFACSCSSSSPLLLRLLLRLQCVTLRSLSRFPFHDSQVLKTLLPCRRQ